MSGSKVQLRLRRAFEGLGFRARPASIEGYLPESRV